jgi:hypothetical protein
LKLSLSTFLVGGVLLGGLVTRLLAGPAALRSNAAPPRLRVNPLRHLPEPVELRTLVHFLERMGLLKPRIDEGQGFVQVRIRGKSGRFDLYIIPRREFLHLQIPHLFTVSRDHLALEKLQSQLLELNWVNVLGKYSWDSRDGEVRYSHTLVVSGGVRFGDFSLAVAQCLSTVDLDYPVLQRVLGGNHRGGGRVTEGGVRGTASGGRKAGSRGRP